MAFPTIPTVAAGRVLFALNLNPAGTHTSPSLSSLTKASGDLLVAIVILYDGNSTNAEFSAWGGSFTEFGDFAGTTTMAIGCAYKWSNGSETGTFTVTSADTSANDSCFILLAIPGAHPSTPPEAGSFATGTAPDSAAFNPAGWDAEDTLWISVGASGEDSLTGSYTGIGTAPTNYTNQADSGISADAIGGVEGSVAFRQINAASEDPGTWSMDTSNARGASLVIAVRPDNSVTGTGAITVPAATVAGTGVMHPSGTGAITVPAPTVAGTGEEILTATGAIVVPPPAVAGTGEEVFTATGALSVPAPTVAGTGDHTEGGPVNPDGTGAITVPAATVAGTGSVILTGSGAITVPAPTVAGAGAEVFTGTGAIVVPTVLAVGSGALVIAGTGSIVIPAATIVGAGSHGTVHTGTGAIVAAAPVVAGAGNVTAGVFTGGPGPSGTASVAPAPAGASAAMTPLGAATMAGPSGSATTAGPR